MYNGQDTLFGNEWIEDDQKYFKIKVWEDGIYRIQADMLLAAGVPNSIEGIQFQLFYLGEQQPIYTSSEGKFSPDDFISFYGLRNRQTIDQFLFENAELEALNPEYSLISDTSVYFLTWSEGSHLRFESIESDLSNLNDFEPFCHSISKELNTSAYNQLVENSVFYSTYDGYEGYSSRFLTRNTHQLNIEGQIVSGMQARLKIRIVPNNNTDNRILSIKLNDQEIFQDTAIIPLLITEKVIDFDSELLLEGGLLTIEGLGSNLDRYAYSVVELDFIKNFDAEGESFFEFVLPSSTNTRFIKVENFSFDELPLLFNLKNNQLISPNINNTNVEYEILPGDSSQYLMVDPVLFKEVVGLIAMPPMDEVKTENYLIIAHERLIGNPDQPVQEYAAYRQSLEGGDHNVRIINVENLYDYFSYGIYGHPISIRNFAHFLNKNGQSPQVFLLGKGLESNRVRNALADIVAQNMIPTFGSPGSDNLLFSTNATDKPILEYGRVGARNVQEIFNYLNKVKLYDASLRLPRTAENWAWRKRYVHLIGGSIAEQASFENWMNPLKFTAESAPLQGKVTTFRKVSSDPIQTSVSDDIIDEINEGVFVKTFFGHGGVTITDFGLDDAGLFEVSDRIPIIFSLGCQTGNIFTLENSVSENFLLDEAGAIAYLATSGYGITSSLSGFGNEFYRLLNDSTQVLSLGHINKEVRKRYDDFSFPYVSLNQQLSFHGDPALRVSEFFGPDLVIDERTIKHFPDNPTIQNDSVLVSFELVNLGTTLESQIVVIELIHQFENGEITYRDSFLLRSSFNKIEFKIPLADAKFRGINSIRLKIDPDNQVAEIPEIEAEENNEIQFSNGIDFYSFFVSEKDVLPIFPADNAILTDSFLTISCSPTEIFSENVIEYLIQIDSTKSFNSPFFKEKKFSQKTGLIKWDLSNLNLQSEQVYYWRTTIDSTITNGKFNWKTRSFVYRENSSDRGWHHSHRQQWQENSFQNLDFDSTSQQFRFSKNVLSAVADAMILSPTNNSVTRFLLNGIRIYRGSFRHGANIATVVLDPITGQQVNYASGNVFNTKTPEGRKLLIELIRDSIPAGHYVTVLSFQTNPANTYEPEIWAVDSIDLGINLFQLLEAQGVSLLQH